MKPTIETYNVLQQAYDHFNKAIFGKTLPQCLITLSGELRTARGYYRRHPFKNKEEEAIDEIALNPFTFLGRTDREVFSTLVHEMVHLWQFHAGTPPKKAGHNKEWADKMESIGLMPSSTADIGGKRTGRKVSHYIIPGALFDQVEPRFTGVIEWRGELAPRVSKGSRRTKYTCPHCELNAYGKADILILCGSCSEETGDLVVMEG
jgi:hypothetical protein